MAQARNTEALRRKVVRLVASRAVRGAATLRKSAGISLASVLDSPYDPSSAAMVKGWRRKRRG